MSDILRLKHFLEKNMNHNKKTIMIQSLYNTYRKTIEYITNELISLNKYNIIFIYGEPKGMDVENLICSFMIPLSDNFNIDNIDLVILDDGHSNNIDTHWMNVSAPRMEIPHNILQGNIHKNVKYNFTPSKSAFKNTHNCPEIIFFKGGYPKLDISILEYKRYCKINNILEDSIIYAPTIKKVDNFKNSEYMMLHIDDYNDLLMFDYKLILTLLKNFNYTILFRPHPFDVKRNAFYLQDLMSRFIENDRVIMSTEYYINDYARSKFMVSDLSQTVYTYSMTTLKPIIVFANLNKKDKYSTKKFGYRVETLKQLVKCTNKVLKSSIKYKNNIKLFRKKNIYNIGKSMESLVKVIDKIVYKEI